MSSNAFPTVPGSRRGRAPLLAAVVALPLLLAGCGGGEAPADTPPPASLSAVPGQDGVQKVTLTEAAVQRLDLRTTAVAAPAAGSAPGATATVPYTAVVYAEDGSTWTYVEDGTRSYVRTRVDVLSVSGDTALLRSGPAVGTPVVVVGAPELLGAEAQISGEE